MSDVPLGESSTDNRLNGVIASYIEAIERGELPDTGAYLARYPDLADALSQFFDDRSKFQKDVVQVAPPPPEESPGPVVTCAETETLSEPTAPSVVSTATRYTELTLHKQGGLGALFCARDEELHRDVVIKFIHEKCRVNLELLTQFNVEAEVTGRLDHPGVVPVYGIGQDWEGHPFYVMRMIHGCELRQEIAEYHEAGGPANRSRESRQRLFALLEHLANACNTVAYAHDVGIVHCDLKPSNIMIGKYGETFVLDWGLATSFERTSTFFTPNEPTIRPRSAGSSQSGQRGGTYGYISPEQLSVDEPVTPKSDVYSLGATLFEILTGRPPFNGRALDVADQIRGGRFPAPRELQPRLSRKLEAICLKAMKLSPDARYRTAKHLAGDLKNWMRDDEVRAAPDAALGRVSRLARRHRVATIAVFVAMLFGTATATWAHLSRRHSAEAAQLSLEHAEKEAELRKLVELNFNTALNTFEELCWPMANGEIGNLGVFGEFTDAIEEFTSDYLLHFEHNESMREQTARVYELRATAARAELLDDASALNDYAKAEEIFTKLVDSAQQSTDFAIGLARIRLSQGRLLLERDEFAKAREKLMEVRTALVALRHKQPADLAIKRYLAEANHVLGRVCLEAEPSRNKARHETLMEAGEFFEDSKSLREDLISGADSGESRSHKRDLARTLGYLGDLHLAQGLVRLARADFLASFNLRDNLYREDRFDLDRRFQYARGLANFGALERDFGDDFAAARSKLDAAQAIQEDLVKHFGDVPTFAFDQGTTLTIWAEVELFAATDAPQGREEHLAKAGELAEQAMILYRRFRRAQSPASPTVRAPAHGLAESYVLLALVRQTSNPEKSVEDACNAEKVLGPYEDLNAEELFTLALARSLQDDSSKLADAMVALRESIKRGQNAVKRIERHRKLGFGAIMDSPHAGEFESALTELCENVQLK